MFQILSINAQKLMKCPWWRFWRRHSATTPRRPTGATNKTPADNFLSMKLIKKELASDSQGRWWSIETRQDLATGLILREKRRITD